MDEVEVAVAEHQLSWEQYYEALRLIAEEASEWAGIPAPMRGFRLHLEERYPWKMLEHALDPDEEFRIECHDIDEGFLLRNRWYSKRRGGYVYVYQDGNPPRAKVAFDPRNRSAERLRFWMQTIGASRAWDANTEWTALEKLESLVTPETFRHYMLTGAFFETSPRSRVTYMFRRNRPTVAMTPIDHDDEDSSMRCIAVLCLHPIGFYQDTWAGVMCPTDDVIAHLMLMRGDEHAFWKWANHHDPEDPAAGI